MDEVNGNGESKKGGRQMKDLGRNETIALAKVIKDAVAKDASAGLSAGEYLVDFTVRVSGSFKKGEDYDQEIVAKADPWLLLAATLSHLNGVTVESIVREALTADVALVDSLKENAAKAIQAIKGPTNTTCNGKITTKLAVAVV